MVDVEFSGGAGTTVPHLTNILFHAANSVLLFVLLFRLTGAQGRSWLVAALFALHPLNVESVAWVAERKNVLSTFFWFLALLAYARFAAERAGRPDDSVWRNRHYLMTLLWFVLGLMSKPMLVTLPFTLLLVDFWPLWRIQNSKFQIKDWRALVLEKWPFFVLSLASCVVTYLAQKYGNALQAGTKFVWPLRLENVVVSYLRYLGKAFWPVDLSVAYPFPKNLPVALVVLAIVVLGVMTFVALWRCREGWLFTGWFWFLGTLVPVIGLVQVGSQAMADRYAYVPLIGIFIGVVWGGWRLWEALKLPPAGAMLLAATVLVVCGGLTRQQMKFWQNDGVLFTHALAVTSDNTHAHVTLGVYLGKHGDPEGALKHYQIAAQLDPEDKSAHYDLGCVLEDLNRPEEAEKEYREAIRIDSKLYVARYNLAILLSRLGKKEEAIVEFQRVLQANPDFTPAQQQLQVLGVNSAAP